ncbi:unnamed protein product [Rotaria sordida]|uniref:RanBP2-type domain-containing protein n=1 Tax=Rotaria sordida TaxID=392033 RepID=A0A814S465_9BILA|nr:unnamed protein product [Rotaria sordida]
MSRSSSNRSANSGLKNSSAKSHHYRSMPTIFKNSRSSKKQHSLILNNADFEICQVPNESEMFEITQHSNTEGSNNTNQLETTTSDNTLTDRQEQSANVYNNSPTTSHDKFSISQLKTRLIPYRYENTKKDENGHDKNQGFLLINQADDDLVLIHNDNVDQQHTRHSEPCEHGRIDEDNVDVSQIQLIPTTPITPSLLPPQQSSLISAISPVVNHLFHEPDVQATQAGVECATPIYDESNEQDTQLSATNSSSSTNSSNNDPQLTEIDRSTLSDTDYILAQKSCLEQITGFEIDLINDRRDYLQGLQQIESDDFDINLSDKEATLKNKKLKEELKRLEEEQDRVYSSWSCEVCTYINEPFIKTRKDVCEMCEGPSPLKRHTLTN